MLGGKCFSSVLVLFFLAGCFLEVLGQLLEIHASVQLQYTEMKKEKLLLADYLAICIQIPKKLILGLLSCDYSAVFPEKKNNELNP